MKLFFSFSTHSSASLWKISIDMMDPFECRFCQKKFNNKKQIQGHWKQVHSVVRYECQLCDKSFKTRDGLSKHKNYHTGDRPYSCTTCGQSFADPSACKNHEKYQHAEIDPSVSCDVCGKSFKRMREMKRHKVIHDLPINADGSKFMFSNEFKIEALKSVAKIGPTKTSNQMKIPYTTLRNWIKTCKEDKSFNCQYCGKMFSSKNKLNYHEEKGHIVKKTEFGRGKKFSKSFRREVADFALANSVRDACRKFSLADSSVRNILRILKTPFQCKICERKCTHARQLQKHMADVHKILDLQKETKKKPEKTLAEHLAEEKFSLNDSLKTTLKDIKNSNTENSESDFNTSDQDTKLNPETTLLGITTALCTVASISAAVAGIWDLVMSK